MRARGRTGSLCAVVVLAVSVVFAVSSCAGTSVNVVARNGTILLVPPVNAGGVGWCVKTIREAWKLGGCGDSRSRVPIVAQSWTGGGRGGVVSSIGVTAGDAAAVSVFESGPLATHAERVLPAGLRAVFVEIHGDDLETAKSLPAFVPLSASGAVLPQAARFGPSLNMYAETNSLRDPADPPPGVCAIRAKPLAGLVAQGGSVVSELRAYRGLIGEAFLACASTGYLMDGWPILASVLVDAAHPGRTPAPLPAMRPVPGRAGLFEAPGDEGPQVARRVPGAWLVVSKGEGLQQRLALLEDLRVTGDARVFAGEKSR